MGHLVAHPETKSCSRRVFGVVFLACFFGIIWLPIQRRNPAPGVFSVSCSWHVFLVSSGCPSRDEILLPACFRCHVPGMFFWCHLVAHPETKSCSRRVFGVMF